MRLMQGNSWTRRGCSLLWCPEALETFSAPSEVVSLREFFSLATRWPEDLPSNDGRALVVAGLEGCLDALASEDVPIWIGEDLKPSIFSFQDEYQGDAALVFWLPSGARMPSGSRRWRHDLATGEYGWSTQDGSHLPIGRLLWAGAEEDAERIVTDGAADVDGDAWVGMYHPRIS